MSGKAMKETLSHKLSKRMELYRLENQHRTDSKQPETTASPEPNEQCQAEKISEVSETHSTEPEERKLRNTEMKFNEVPLQMLGQKRVREFAKTDHLESKAEPAAEDYFQNSLGKRFELDLSDEAKEYAQEMAANALTERPPTVANLKMMTMEVLETLLKFNDRPSYNLSKHELAAMILDYMKHGCPPRCPKCKKGALRFSNGKKKYGKRYFWCPGSTPDGKHFYGCSFRASRNEVSRIPWKSP